MNYLFELLLHSEIAHFAMYIVVSAFISGMPAPTATSGVAYKWAFSSLNIIAANISRASSTAVEKSPNFTDAVVKKINGSAAVSSVTVTAVDTKALKGDS